MKAVARPFSVALICAVLASCGGGDSRHSLTTTGGSGGSSLQMEGGGSSQNPGTTPTASSVAALCANPRSGTNPATGTAYPDQPGTLATEKSWVRAWIDDAYLWYDEVPGNLQASDFSTPQAFFDVLKTPATTASGQPKDRFHYAVPTASWQSSVEGSGTVGYGMEIAILSESPPREVRVAYVTPGSPAATAGILRGDKVVTLDTTDVANGSADALNAALFPSNVGESHTITVSNGSGTRSVALTAASIVSPPVMNVTTLSTSGGPVGYLQFNDHNEQAETQLAAAIQKFQTDGVTGLVLDMRYNGGGLLGIASELAYMVAGSTSTQGKTFEKLVTNRKNPYGLTEEETIFPFMATAVGYSMPAGQSLPSLGLSKVTVLAGPDTCSASESLVNSLRGIGLQVNLVGGTTCGKPYGFFPEDNCGTTYLAINFQGVNAQGFGDYGDGMAPTCVVADDFDHQLGNPSEARLAAALTLQAGSACPAPTSSSSGSGLQKSGATLKENRYLRRDPLREIKRLDTRVRPQS